MNNYLLWLLTMRRLPRGTSHFFGKTPNGDMRCLINDQGRTCIHIPVKEINGHLHMNNFLEPQCLAHTEMGQVIELSWNGEREDEIALLFVEDLLDSIDFWDQPVDTLNRKQLVWKDFLVKGGSEKLNRVIGLWGELFVLSQWAELAPFWIGPTGADIDYKSASAAFDVKTTRSKQSPVVKVSSDSQLDWEGRSVFICHIRVEAGTENDVSLKTLMDDKNLMYAPKQTRVALDGLVKDLDPDVMELKFTCRDIQFFEISNPDYMLSRAKLSDCLGVDVMNRISNLTYDLSLVGLPATLPESILNLLTNK